jgi:hypothetical protein
MFKVNRQNHNYFMFKNHERDVIFFKFLTGQVTTLV